MSGITATQIDELKANGYKLTTGSKSRNPWWMPQAAGSSSQPNDCDTFAAAASAAWEHYMASKRPERPSNVPEHAEWRLPRAGETYMDRFGFTNRAKSDWSIVTNVHNYRRWCWRDEPQRPAKPEYPSGWVCVDGRAFKVGEVYWYNDEWCVRENNGGLGYWCRSVKECPPRPEPPKGWRLTGRIVDVCKCDDYTYWMSKFNGFGILSGRSSTATTPCLRWEVVRDVPQVYDAATFPKGEVWVRRKGWAKDSRDLVQAICTPYIYAGPTRPMTYQILADHYELSTDGGRTWKPARPE